MGEDKPRHDTPTEPMDRSSPGGDASRASADSGKVAAEGSRNVADGAAWIGRRLGPWLLVRRIGQGGMGEVFLAERADQRYSGRAAIKLVRTGSDTDTLLDRFRSEGEILAQLDHPGIARLLDAGATDEGWPYLVMEYVDGMPLDLYSRRLSHSLSKRLALFVQICRAVQHAHAALVVHRDLKPSNILVTPDGQVKLLDFGIARLLEAGDQSGAVTVERALTPAYAAPEQVRGEATTTATDVYALGLLLHEMLTGQRVVDFGTDGQMNAMRYILEAPAQPPSEVLARDGDASERSLARRLVGDLDAIVLKALAKEPRQRYRSVEQLADDIERHRDSLPVIARNGSFAYRLSCFAGRNRWSLLGGACVFIALVTGFGLAVQHASIASTERVLAEQRLEQVRELAGAMLFELHDAIEPLPGSTPARELLVKRALEYLASLAAESSTDPRLLGDLADAYERVGNIQGNPYIANLGDSHGARASYESALELRRQRVALVGLADPELRLEAQRALANGHDRMGEILEWTDQPDSARTHYLAGREIRAELLDQYPDNLRALRELAVSDFKLGNLARILRDYDEAALRLGKALESFTRLQGFEPEDSGHGAAISIIQNNLGDVAAAAGNLPAALAAYRKAHALAQRSADAHPGRVNEQRDLIISLSRIGNVHDRMGDHARALGIHRQVHEKTLALLEQEPSDRRIQRDLVVAEVRLSESYRGLGRLPNAAEHLREAIAGQTRLAENDPANLALKLELAGQLRTAADLSDEVGADDQALSFLRRAEAVLAEIVQAQPDHERAGRELAETSRILAER